MALLIHGIIFRGGLGTIILRKKLPFVDITHVLYSVDSMLGEAVLQVACSSSNSQN